ncbi:SpoIVB peptidase [Lentibacillus sp. CBA3610]|uniref:SpoIVB peptidase n=1 Tax=Lentibacillus sp. CBA3610 TaxID=2518176 RepID=UPI001595A7B4|nr:SpoIVB peptidase [Lentibacillus sp. CBA3610]QKY69287.1 SpoIVB peptidase [Lentibacillus sp. CBA3610]
MRRVNWVKYHQTFRLLTGILLLIAILAVPFIAPVNQYLSIPNQVTAFDNASSPINVPALGDNVSVNTSGNSLQAIDSTEFYAKEPGNHELIYEAAGMPIKKVDVSALEDIEVIPGGQSIGVQLHTLGVLVVGHHQIKGENGMVSPGEDANIEVGDVILEINGEEVKEMEDVKPVVEEAGENDEKMDVKVKRDDETIKTTLDPVKDAEEGDYRIGLYIRDSAAGIGTMTFYDPETKNYGALGHVISDMDTQKPIEIHNGSIVRSNVTSIEKGNHGTPGEKQAKFSMQDEKIGSITKNSPFGIFGELNKPIKNGEYDEPMPIALSHEVKEGPAKILTVLEGEEVKEFDVKVVSSVPQKFPAKKGMVVQITDEELLNETGGIVQGMSGSPIIQDGKVIGAVTHVFVNDPTSGYGVHIEWMLQETGVEVEDKEGQDQAS